jgi:hypothetical protein
LIQHTVLLGTATCHANTNRVGEPDRTGK